MTQNIHSTSLTTYPPAPGMGASLKIGGPSARGMGGENLYSMRPNSFNFSSSALIYLTLSFQNNLTEKTQDSMSKDKQRRQSLSDIRDAFKDIAPYLCLENYKHSSHSGMGATTNSVSFTTLNHILSKDQGLKEGREERSRMKDKSNRLRHRNPENYKLNIIYNTNINPLFDNFYVSDVIGKSSITMGKCTNQFKTGLNNFIS